MSEQFLGEDVQLSVRLALLGQPAKPLDGPPWVAGRATVNTTLLCSPVLGVSGARAVSRPGGRSRVMCRVVAKGINMSTPANKTAAVDAYMARLEYPMTAEVEAILETIKGIDRDITDEVKWNAPSFSY
jgi:hypothetical protein